MALLWFQGFDYLPTGSLASGIAGSMGMNTGLSGGGGVYLMTPGRFGYGNYCQGSISQVVASHVAHGFLGFASTVTPNVYNPQLQFIDGVTGIIHCYLEFCPYGVIKLWGKGNAVNQGFQVLGVTDVDAYFAGPWNYYEVEAVIAASNNGSMTVRCNTTPILSFSSITTQSPASSNSFFTVFNFLNQWVLDDMYLCDATGSAPLNTYLGNVRCQALLPGGSGASTQWSPSNTADANWQCAANTKMDDSLYVYSPTTGAEDNYAVKPLINTPLVVAVQTRLAARQDDATQRTLEAVLISNGTEVTGAPVNLSQSYAVQSDMFVTDPATGLSWLYPAVNLLKVGQRITA